MRKFFIAAILMALVGAGSALKAQNNRYEGYLGLPGDNLNLYAVLKLFQDSKTLEDFERDLNDENSNINNLDLNNDNQVDYIKVMDNVDGDVHNIVLQDALGPHENQDVAVITVQRFRNGEVQIQLTGDEELYGKDYIIEPRIDDSMAETPNPGYSGGTVTIYRTTPVEIAAWPIVRFVYMPSYRVWHSNWYWGYYPTYWHAWRPFSYHYYYGYHYNWYHTYYGYYRPWHYHRYTRWNDFYYRNNRTYSPEVSHRIKSGVYKTTYSHPEQRREGEERFARSHPDEMRRINESSARSNDRRSAPSVNRSVNSNTNDRNNRSINTNTRRSSPENNTRINNTPTVNPSSNRSVNNNPSTNRSSDRQGSSRSVRTERSNNSSPAVNRSSNPSTNNNAVQRNVSTNKADRSSARSSEQTKTNSASSSSRRKADTKTETRKVESTRKSESKERRQ